ncbi:hypothetical protein BTVI_36411 [Pitangus sulphuratus]|nr:hypothetical protein BTVI_36411 [Pitangus sulphuratus]
MGRPVLLAAVAALLLLPPGTGAAVTRLRVSANFVSAGEREGGGRGRTLSRPRCRRPSRPVPPLEPPALSLSRARLCLPAQPCQPCLRVRLALPAAELGGVRGLQLTFLELSSNRAGWLQVWKRRRMLDSSTWQVQFDCFPAESGQQILVSLRTIPDRGLSLSRSHLVAAEPRGPVFTHAWVPEARAIDVWVPEGPALMVRLCHQLALECEELPRPFHQQVLVPGGHHILLPYEFLVPCLCIEASYPHHDSLRRKRCPFRDQPDAYGPELWSSVRFHDYSASSKDQMAMALSGSCPLHPRATLCWREAADEASPCHSIPNSTASEEEQVYTLDKVDVHPQLCFRFSYGNSSHVECPHRPETAWNVSVSVWGLQLRLHLSSRIPAAFSAALCQRRGGQCEPEAPLYTVTQVWRSDVHFARKQLLCPDVSRRHFGLLGLALALGLVVTVLLLNCRGAWRPDNGVPGGRPVLLLYSPDSEEHLGLVCTLAERLRAGLGCDVHLDLWEAGGLGQSGTLPWLYAQRGRVGRQHGTVLLLWSRGSSRLFHRWQPNVTVLLLLSGHTFASSRCVAVEVQAPLAPTQRNRTLVWLETQDPLRATLCPFSHGALPGHPNDLLLLEHGGNASLCAVERDACTPLTSFTSTGRGHPGLLEQDLQRDVAAGQCWQGLERTEHEGFGGGNTAWEEEKLSKYQHSETRLLEVLEGVCAPSDFACHQLLERSEEHVEQWWFHERQQHPDFFHWLCVDRLMLCCPPGTYGPDCRPCAGGPRQPCSGNGRCDGDGTRRGTGLCVCSPGYGGPFCAECGDGYYEASRNKSHLMCAECYQACGRCTGPEDSSCLRCKRGWVLHEHRCIDIDECGTEMAHCRANQYCVNTEGSYECRDCSTACIGCMGAGPARCKKCNKGYWRDGAKCLDVDECASAEEPVCTGAQEVCENTEGSYRCVCAQGHVRRDGQCVEDRPPDAPEKGFFDDVTDDEVVVLQQMFFGVMICALATLAAKGDMVFTAIFIGAVAAMAGYWLSDRSDRVLDGFMKGR